MNNLGFCESANRLYFLEVFKVQETEHSPSTVPTTLQSQVFCIIT